MFFSQTHLMARTGGLIVLLFAVASVSGQSNNLLKNSNGNEDLQSWLISGNGSISDCVGLGKCFSIWQDGFIYQDVDVSEAAAGTFAVFIAFASIEEPTQEARLLGHPYLYGYFMTGGNSVKQLSFPVPTGRICRAIPVPAVNGSSNLESLRCPTRPVESGYSCTRGVLRQRRRLAALVTFVNRASFFFLVKTRPGRSSTLINRSLNMS